MMMKSKGREEATDTSIHQKNNMNEERKRPTGAKQINIHSPLPHPPP